MVLGCDAVLTVRPDSDCRRVIVFGIIPKIFEPEETMVK